MEISVVMPVYNGEKYICESIESILSQSFRDFELIIVDDGSKDRTQELIRQYNDSRIKLLHNNHDFIGTLNKGMEAARGKYIARMDADDTMHPLRLEKQYALMEKKSHVTVCASWLRFFGDSEKKYFSYKGEIAHPLIQMLRGNLVVHPSAMLRREFFVRHGLRYEYYDCAEDFKLWSEAAKKDATFYIIPEPLLNYRVSKNQISFRRCKEQTETSLKIQCEILDYLIGTAGQEKETLQRLAGILNDLNERELLSENIIFELFYDLFGRMI